MKENKIPAQIFMLVNKQVLTRWNGEQSIVIDIDHNAVWSAINNYPEFIYNKWNVFCMIINAFHYFLRKEIDNA